jgi:hypothetical protein
MAKYSVFVFCDECLDTHPMDTTLDLPDGTTDVASVAETYAGKELPTSLINMMNKPTRCPNTARFFRQSDNSHIFLVADK